jgi:8-oxo-dGTP pyrophosphatase MutT (NUDIX family)
VTLDELSRRLPEWLAGELPGPAGQLRMSPRPRFGWRPGRVPDDCRHSGVLLLVYPRDGEPHLVLTLRSSRLPNHAGQVSLPGGALEPGESSEAAALREAHEEIGVEPSRVQIVGALSPLHVPVSGYVLHPWVGLAGGRPRWRPDAREVERVLEVPLARLCDPAHVRLERRERGQRRVEVPYFALDRERVWGATAMVLAEFACLLGAPPEPGGGMAG